MVVIKNQNNLDDAEVSIVDLPESGDVKVIGSEESLGITKQQQVAADALDVSPDITPTPKIQRLPTPERRVQTDSGSVKANFGIFLGRAPNETELAEFMRLSPTEVENRLRGAQQDEFKRRKLADIKRAGTPFGVSPEEALRLGFDPTKTSEDFAADALGEDGAIEGEVVDEPPATTKETTEDVFKVPEFDEIMEKFGISKIIPSDFSEIKRLEQEALTDRLLAIDIDFDEQAQEQEDKNDNALAALQAKLIKLGVSPSGTSFSNVEAGEISRGQERLDAVETARSKEKALARAKSKESISQISREERAEVFNAQIADMNNLFQGIGLATDIMSVFDGRDQSIKNREQAEKEFVRNLNFDYINLDSQERESRIGRVLLAAENGDLGLSDEDVGEYNRLEVQAGYPENFIVNMAIKGLQSKLTNMAKDVLDTEKIEAEIEHTKAQTARTKGLTAKSIAEIGEQGEYPEGFWTDIKIGTSNLQKGEEWGTVWDRIKMKYPTVQDVAIDKALGTQWREGGAFEEFKQKGYKPTETDKQVGVWQWLTTEEAINMSNEERKTEIMAAGFNPEDFNIY